MTEPISSDADNDFQVLFDAIQQAIHLNAKNKGFWDKPPEVGTSLMLIVSELGEALEGFRAGNPMSEKIPPHLNTTEELADAVIRILDFAGYHRLDLSGAILAKIKHNRSRPHKHGKEF